MLGFVLRVALLDDLQGTQYPNSQLSLSIFTWIVWVLYIFHFVTPQVAVKTVVCLKESVKLLQFTHLWILKMLVGLSASHFVW